MNQVRYHELFIKLKEYGFNELKGEIKSIHNNVNQKILNLKGKLQEIEEKIKKRKRTLKPLSCM